MSGSKATPFSFPKRFLWGAATAAHQVEGGNHNQWSVWELENARALAAQAPHKDEHLARWEEIRSEATNPRNYVSGVATDHYTRYREDFDLLEEMNMNAYRFSIEWSRIEPDEGAWDAEAIEYYRTYLRELRRRNIEPIVTLFHFTLPVWFAEKGAFEHRGNVRYFSRFVEKVMSELGREFRFVITINEPTVYVQQGYIDLHFPPQRYGKILAWRVLKNLAYAHNQAARVIRQSHPRTKISLAHNSTYYYPGDDAWLSRVSARLMQYFSDDYLLKKVVKRCDFLGVNYYSSARVYGYRVHNPETRVSDMGWAATPGDIEYTILRLWDRYKLPVMITENGLADRNDQDRQWWITQTLLGLQRAIKEDARVIGYIHWSLTDNFEWGFGRWPRFGLAHIDYATGTRTLRPSARWFGTVLKKLRR